MRNFTLLILLCCLSLSVYSQSIYQAIQPVSIEELQMVTYEGDLEAEALVLYDYGETYFVPSTQGFEIMFKRTTRIKILNESGIDWAEIKIPIYIQDGREEKFSQLRGITYNLEEGKMHKTELNIDQVYDEKLNQYWKYRKTAMPNVKVGSIIEYSYLTSSKFFYNFRDWEFQWEIPVLHSEYQTKLTPFYTYTWILQGANKFDSKKSQKASGLDKTIAGIKYKEMTHNYVMKNIPAFKDADFITTKNDFIIKMDWQLTKYSDIRGIQHEVMSTWEKIVKGYQNDEYFGKYINKAYKKAPKLIDVEAISQLNDREKVAEVITYVKQNFDWNGYLSDQSTQSLNDFLKKKAGRSADINLFTIGLLNAVGIEARGLIVSTRENGRIYYDYPFTHYFNSALIYAKVDGEFELLDATNIYLSNWRVPDKCINGKGLLIQKKEVEWIPLKSNMQSEIAYQMDISFVDDEIQTKIKSVYKGRKAADKREEVSDDTYNPVADLMESEGLEEESVEFINLKEIESDFIIQFDYVKDFELGSDKIYFSPFFDEIFDENPLKEKYRKYPIDFTYSRKHSFVSSIEIPEGYELDYMKSDHENLNNDYIDIQYNASEKDGKVIIEFSYWFKQSVYPSSSYSRLKYYFKDIINLGQENVVFVKKP